MSFWNKIEKPGFEPQPAAPPPRSQPVAPRTEAVAPPPAAERAAPPPPAAERVAPPPPAPAVREEPAPHQLRLGRGVRLEGKLTFSGTVRIDATFQGSIVADGVLVVGTEAKVDADIACSSVVVEGEVNGNVVAREAVELHRTATLRGDVETPSLAIERGAVFQGASRRPSSAVATPGKAAPAPTASVH
jgi:cytoskeletal protein CcmA (bactofilin family)